MIIVGLTGSIGMGKSTVARQFQAAGDAVFDADAAVHALYSGRAAPLVEAAFPGTAAGGVVDRRALGARVFGDDGAIKTLERIVHPLVREEETAFLDKARAQRMRIAVLDIPLLLETKRDGAVDAVVVVSAPAEIQRARVLSRPGMTAERFDAILAKQMPDEDKRKRAHFVIDTSRSHADANAQVLALRRALLALGAGSRARRPQHNVV